MGLNPDQEVGGQEDQEDLGGLEEGGEDPVYHLKTTKEEYNLKFINITILICKEPTKQ